MISKLVISFTIILIVGHCKGAAVINESYKTIFDQHVNYTNYDLFTFPEFNIENFGLFNRQCVLGSLMYLSKGLFSSIIDPPKKSNLEMIKRIFLRILRSSAGQTFLFHFNKGEDLTNLFNSIRHWLVTFDLQDARVMQSLADKMINIGLSYGVWYTNKELTLLDAFRYRDSELIITAVNQCEIALENLAIQTQKLENDYLENLYSTGVNDFPPQLRARTENYGIIVFLMTPDEYKNIFHTREEETEQQYYKVLDIVQSAVENIFDGILNILYSRNIFACDFLGIIELPLRPKIQIELLLLLQEIFPSIVEIARELFLLQQTKFLQTTNEQIFDFDKYMIFSKKFTQKWTFILNQEYQMINKPLKSNVGENVNKPSDGQTSSPSAAEDGSKMGSENMNKPNDGQTSSPSAAQDGSKIINIADPGNSHPLNDGRLIKNGVVSPSLMLFYGVFKNSWNDKIHDETNTNQNKMLLFEIKAWITLIDHSLKIMPLELMEKRKEILLTNLNKADIWKQLNADSTFMDKYNPHSA